MATRQYITEQKLTGAQIDHDAHEVEQIVRSPDTRRLFTDRMADTNNKNKRYDRQIRIWGPHGQQRLESCRVALLNCSPTGSETLKNLVLGGIVGFTIIDGAKVSPQDLGNNFMVEASSLGESRAKVVTDLLQELNDTVSGSYMEETPEGIITNNPGFFGQFTVVIATQVDTATLCRLQICMLGGDSGHRSDPGLCDGVAWCGLGADAGAGRSQTRRDLQGTKRCAGGRAVVRSHGAPAGKLHAEHGISTHGTRPMFHACHTAYSTQVPHA